MITTNREVLKMAFGKAFETRKEAKAHADKINKKTGRDTVKVRKMSKKIHPRRKKLFHVGDMIDFLNFA
jgi:ribosomal protein S17